MLATAMSATEPAALPFSARTAPPLQLALAGVATAAATLACWWLDGRMSVAGLALVYLVAVVATAALLNRTAGVAASLMCVCALNYFFVPPRYSFEVDGAEYWWTLAVLLGVSLGLNTLIAGVRARQVRAEQGEARAAQLHALGETMAQCRGHASMAQQAARWLTAQLGLTCAVFVRGAEGEPLAVYTALPAAQFHPQSVEWAIEHGRALGRGCPDWPDLPLWCAPFSQHGARGAVQLLLGRDENPGRETLDHWQSLARQVGLSVERERAAEAAEQAQDLAHSEATRNTLLASLSHDLRTPLAAIIGSASALRAQGDSMSEGQRARLLANLENEARDMTLMADNILQMARLSQPRWRLATHWESVEELLGSAVERMRRRWQGARIQWRVPAGLPPVQAEAGLIAQVIANLVDNALRHAGSEAEVIIQAGRSRDGVFIAVRDHGPGLPEGGVDQLFDRYQRGSGGARAGGTGLGLAICKTIVQAHGGQIRARRCTPGSEFRIDLPVANPKQADE
ncbi:MAG: putative histidine kinase, classic [Ramlibacter sp.]|nr:putative histidine kinase, classic [Ramlibacter sp.]